MLMNTTPTTGPVGSHTDSVGEPVNPPSTSPLLASLGKHLFSTSAVDAFFPAEEDDNVDLRRVIDQVAAVVDDDSDSSDSREGMYRGVPAGVGYGGRHREGLSGSVPVTGRAGSGFVVEGVSGRTATTSPSHGPLLHPPAYTNGAASSPFTFSAAPTGVKPPPPSFEEAIASTPMHHATDTSPMAHYVPPMPSAPQDTVLVRNANGVFLLEPLEKPAPPYAQAPTNTPPVSPIPMYSLPDPSLHLPSAATGHHTTSSGRPSAPALPHGGGFAVSPSQTGGPAPPLLGGSGGGPVSRSTPLLGFSAPPPYPG